jgi:predicted secreted hydrolase
MAAVAILPVLPGERIPASARLRDDTTQVQGSPENSLQSSYPGFTRADPKRRLRFPEDHGPHPDFLTEWWYYTGNLETGDGQHYGYQLTFFRRALAPPQEWTERASKWGSTQAYLAHFAVTDVAEGRFHSVERFSRGGAGLAGATGDPSLRVWLEDWSLEETGPGRYRLQAAQDGMRISLELVDRKGPVLQGQNGYSPKGPEVGNASHYVSQTRLETTGNITIGGQEVSVHGWSWMDHEFSTSALSAGQVGWDWFALQMNDGSELMVFQLRRVDGTPDPYSSGTYIFMDGTSQPLGGDDFTIEVLDTWTSPHTEAEYPSRWRVTVQSRDLVLDIEPYLADQEHQLSTVYWEGAVRIRGSRGGKPVSGQGYVELTGYSGAIVGL